MFAAVRFSDAGQDIQRLPLRMSILIRSIGAIWAYIILVRALSYTQNTELWVELVVDDDK